MRRSTVPAFPFLMDRNCSSTSPEPVTTEGAGTRFIAVTACGSNPSLFPPATNASESNCSVIRRLNTRGSGGAGDRKSVV